MSMNMRPSQSSAIVVRRSGAIPSFAQANAAVGSNLTSPPPDEFEDDPNLRLGLSRRAEPAKHVIAAWLLDSARFNEYCEESDYAWEDPAVRAMRAMREAAEAGCDIAVVTTLPGSKSHENVQRQGFELLYTRAVLVKEVSGA